MLLRRRRVGMGLLGATAVAGTAYAVGSSRARQQDQMAAQEAQQNQRLAELESTPNAPAPQQPPPEAAPEPADQRIEQLQELAKLRDSGVLTDEEFNREKQRILGA